MKNIRYIIKVTATATSDNPDFAREVRTYYYGKNQFLISNREEPLDALSKYFLAEYGYKRRCDAVKASTFWDSICHAKFWDSICHANYWDYAIEIIEYTL